MMFRTDWPTVNAPEGERSCDGSLPASGFSWSFSFGNGFQGTDVKRNDLYVAVYYPIIPLGALDEDPHPHDTLIIDAGEIGLAQNPATVQAALRLFIRDVNSQRGDALTDAEADYLIALARDTADTRTFKPHKPPPPCKSNCI
jgi:hypothetical protein